MLKTIKLDNSLEFVKFTSQELSAICPVNSRPDFYHLTIEFSPSDYTLEVGSLREYLLQFRNTEIFAENLCVKICFDLYTLLKPVYLSVKITRTLSEYNIGIEIFQQLEREG